MYPDVVRSWGEEGGEDTEGHVAGLAPSLVISRSAQESGGEEVFLGGEDTVEAVMCVRF